MRCWYVSDTAHNRQLLGLSGVDAEEATATPASEPPPADAPLPQPPLLAGRRVLDRLSEVNTAALALLVRHLQLKGYSDKTLKTYRNEFAQLLYVLKAKPVDTLSHERLKDYFAWCHHTLKLSENTIHSRLNAVKFYFEQVLKGERFFWEIPRPKKPQLLPRVLSEEKLLRGLLAMRNLKHKALLFTAYSAGLRVSEVVALKISDVDSDRMQLRIEGAKGKKDRVATLARATLEVLREYYKTYQPRYYLFEGEQPGSAYSIRSAQEVFHQCFRLLRLPKQMGFHSLRHSYATHLLEHGTGLKHIQELLGHNDIKTTMRYTHITKATLESVESPLDKLLRKHRDG
jgi:integrase/recombinase XerD